FWNGVAAGQSAPTPALRRKRGREVTSLPRLRGRERPAPSGVGGWGLPLDAIRRGAIRMAPMEPIYDAPHLARNPANCAALTPLGFLARAAAIYPDKLAVVHGDRRFTYRQFDERCRRFADALRRRGIAPGDTVAVMAPNVPALPEAHYAVPMAGAVLNALNYRLDGSALGFILGHGNAKLLIADREFGPLARDALRELGRDLPLVEI